MLLLDTDVMVDVLRKHAPALSWLDSFNEKHYRVVKVLQTIQPYERDGE